ncbi:M15 family metallopeptidase [Microcoleus sp. bin38.metabat.b11b12b14.051]|uniref:M15 family metallopeptidase n=1 Tax=Microcoleus sp. bin38.metabat.b11b12b14.051 TaxID=2742709 RepID=UPI0025DA8948|nr:M15 family metallopeptidase [Microcoleus sp. bin38.metabat.b11b12b14.051]
MKPYQQIAIDECGEPLVPIPPEHFAFETPHAYQKLGAPYQNSKADSPFYLRQGVVDSLLSAKMQLQQNYPNWQILIFDAYRPVEVQQFMVDYTFNQIAVAQGCEFPVSEDKRQVIIEHVYQFWAVPSMDLATPPPHSTGAALDVTLVDENQRQIDMGSAIDEISERSYPDYYANSDEPQKQEYHRRRQILREAMVAAGFQRHPNEWWHFSLGDQMWAWLTNQNNSGSQVVARYGRY